MLNAYAFSPVLEFIDYSLQVYLGNWVGCDFVGLNHHGARLGSDVTFGHFNSF
jgi:hypothetical protein